MKKGAVKMRYPNGDPENGPAYMQQWTGEKWICHVHIPIRDQVDEELYCRNCGVYLVDSDGKRRV
jgi:hypothetical protein